MTLHAFNSNVQLLTTFDLAFADRIVVGTNGFVYGQASLFRGQLYHYITVAGGVASAQVAFELGTALNEANQSALVITQTGIVQGSNALVYTGHDVSVINLGTVVTSGAAFVLSGTAGNGSLIQNAGTITSGGSGVIQGDFGQTEAYTIRNSGSIINTISGYSVVFWNSSIADDRVINSGLMYGSVHMGGGNDLYDGRGGGTVNGFVFGGDGDDRFRPGVTEEEFVGGTGIDTLDFRGGGAVQIALDNAFDATGWAEGDTWATIENVIGSGQADRLGGDVLANRLQGLAGLDTISGGAGNDTLDGGAGIDQISGGGGNDLFILRLLIDAGDRISDFSSAAVGNNDRFGIVASGFGGGLVAGGLPAGLFQSRADNLAQDANDRFIFRATDQTLWFDVDGTGVSAALLLADLQPGASMTSADIVIL